MMNDKMIQKTLSNNNLKKKKRINNITIDVTRRNKLSENNSKMMTQKTKLNMSQGVSLSFDDAKKIKNGILVGFYDFVTSECRFYFFIFF